MCSVRPCHTCVLSLLLGLSLCACHWRPLPPCGHAWSQACVCEGTRVGGGPWSIPPKVIGKEEAEYWGAPGGGGQTPGPCSQRSNSGDPRPSPLSLSREPRHPGSRPPAPTPPTPTSPPRAGKEPGVRLPQPPSPGAAGGRRAGGITATWSQPPPRGVFVCPPPAGPVPTRLHYPGVTPATGLGSQQLSLTPGLMAPDAWVVWEGRGGGPGVRGGDSCICWEGSGA